MDTFGPTESLCPTGGHTDPNMAVKSGKTLTSWPIFKAIHAYLLIVR